MKFNNWIASLVILLTLTAGCGSLRTGSDGAPVNTNDLIQKRTYKYSLARFASSSTMETYLKEAIKKQSLETSSGEGTVTFTNTMTITDGVSGQESSSSGDRSQAVYSTTNLQESGVDEADLIKSDGQYLYLAVKSPYPYYGFMERMTASVMTGGTGGSAGGEDPFYQKYANKIRVMELSDSPPDASEKAVISLTSSSIVDSLYLVTGRGTGLPDLLAVVGTGSAGTPMDSWFMPWYWRNGKTALELFNVSDPITPSTLISLSIDGYLIASRRIGETLYIVSRYTPYIEGYLSDPSTELEKLNNAALLASASLADLLPNLTLDGEDKGDLVKPENCYLPPMPEDAVTTPDIITITAIDLASPEKLRTSCIVGQAETVYVSPQSLYLATTRYRYVAMPLTGDATVSASNAVGITVFYMSPEVETDLHKFSLETSQPVYRGSGLVQGHLGWEQDKKAFRMGEKDGYLRIATSLGETWGPDDTQTMLTVLKESGTAGEERLEEVSRLPNDERPEAIGKPGERLYAARFIGDRAYLVTFRVTDPLYVIDLKDPEDPYIAGELKISGYSDYLQPIGENMLLGIGKDAVPDNSGWGDGRGSWYQGVKLSLFDVSDPAKPAEVDSIVIGKRGTDSDALTDHHAFAYVPPLDGKPARLALPVKLHDTANDYLSGEPWDYYDWTHTGLYLFDIDAEGITSAGQLIADQRSDEKTYDYGFGYDRALILNDSTHFIHEGKVWSAPWGSATSPISAARRRR